MKKNKKIEKEKSSDLPEDNKPNTFDRRGFVKLLAGVGIGAMCPVGGILKLVIDKTISAAEASPALNPRNYVLFGFDGGMSRWIWDGPIIPNGAGDLYEENNMVKTNFKAGGALGFEAEYSTVFTNGYHMPYLWGLDVPKASGGTRPMSELLPNTLIIRGVNMEADDHTGDNMKLTAPVPGMPSVSGLVADVASGLIPAISLKRYGGASTAYMSEKGTGLYTISGTDANFLTSLFAAFQTMNAGSSFRDEPLVKAKIDTAIDILQGYAQVNEHATDPVFRDRKKAEELFRGTLVGLGAGTFDDLTAKYNSLLNEIITNAKNGNIPGITSIPVPGISFPLEVPGHNKKLIQFGHNLTNTQLQTNMYNFQDHILGNPDVKSMFDGANLTEMAKVFALAEFVLLNRLTNSLVCDLLNPLKNLKLVNSAKCVSLTTTIEGMTTENTLGGTTKFDVPPANLYNLSTKSLPVDSHSVGLIPHIMCYSVQYMGLSACLLELIDQLKATRYSTDPLDNRTMFEETIIQIGSEFERIPDHTGAGSQHGWWGNSFTYISGSIKTFKLTGNIYKGTSYPFGGTWGRGAPVLGVGQGGAAALIKPIHCANSVCAMLRIKSVSTADASLVVVTDDDISFAPGIEAPTNKAG